ncbi:hypothetical protein [Dictyobacter alpinus]|uniref:hypothetical protein n=1 Tax=Dictyobacter alpinus TaxID=2014873 RepID=UPI000F821553|nr:hypothetical protein [Dictyobacter alpinus]
MGNHAIVVISVMAILFIVLTLVFHRARNGNSYRSDSSIYDTFSQSHHNHHNGTWSGHHHNTMGGHHGGGFHNGGGGGHH